MSEPCCLKCPSKAEMHPRNDEIIGCEKYHWEINRKLAARQRVCSISRKEERLYARKQRMEERRSRKPH